MNDLIPAWVGKAVYACGIAALLGGSNLLITTARDTAVLQAEAESHIAHESAVNDALEKRLERMEGKIDRLVEGRP